jgi:2-keto-4-pentenoate hydratase/2-oxohepta-3-ene-1,7-dioic acid hydratase in catechol pathway
MATWVRFERAGQAGFGILEGETIHAYEGDMFNAPRAAGATFSLAEVSLLAPAEPTKIIALWNNFHALSAKMKVAEPAEPLYLLKACTSVTTPGASVPRPASYDGRVTYEGELGIVIGKRATAISESEADGVIFGYTCVNDITAADIINRDATFAQWARSKSFDGFCPFGPGIVTGIDPDQLQVKTILNGDERQNYPVSDMIFLPRKLVSLLSHDMTLLPGDLICCGTSVGVGAMKEASNKVDIVIDGIGVLRTLYEQKV